MLPAADSLEPQMRTSTVRVALAAAGLAVVGMVGSSSAVTAPSKLSFTDAAGDALGTQKSYDITKVSFATKGVTTKKGKVVTYKPKSLVVSMTIAGAFATTAGANYEVDADVSGCGYANFTYTPGSLNAGGLFTECGSPPDQTGSTATLYDFPPTVSGSTVTWDIPLSALSPEFKKGAVLSGLSALATQNDPAFGIIGAGAFVAEGNFDNAGTDRSFKI
jgi:hypothetical protein